MRTAEEIADEAMRAFTPVESERFEDESSDVEECSFDYIRQTILEAAREIDPPESIETLGSGDLYRSKEGDVILVDLDNVTFFEDGTPYEYYLKEMD